MKYLLLLLLTCLPALAKDDRELLKCLGAEEKKLHLKKDMSPLYDLNQRLISELLQIPKANISTENFQRICSPGSSPALKVLEFSLSQGKELFIIPLDVVGMQKEMTQGMIEDYVEAATEIFLNFISQIQTQAPTPQCLKEEIPVLDAFFTDIKYLQEDINTKKIFAGREQEIFSKLTNYPEAFDSCRARLKKKPKSESTPRPKKS
jgi:hypothetical protein